jgi:adenine phosphoribosyltransferase
MSTLEQRVQDTIRTIPDFPKPGIQYKDITPVLADYRLMTEITNHFADAFSAAGIDVVVGAESRGFIFGMPIALALKAKFVPVRKAGKLPYKTHSESYDLEYGSATLEIHEDAIQKGEKVLIIDDLLATGGTLAATCKLVSRLEGDIVACGVLIRLAFLEGEKALGGIPCEAIINC